MLSRRAGTREGMVFVSMVSDEVLDRTARYQMMYSCPALRNLTAFGRYNAQRHLATLRSIPRSTARTILVNPEDMYNDDNSTPGDQVLTRQSSPDFRVTLDEDDKSDDESVSDNNSENRAAITERSYPEVIDQFLFPVDLDSDDSDEEANETPARLLDEIRRQVHQSMGVPTSNQGARSGINETSRDARENIGSAPSSAEQVLTPHASFFIGRDKAAVSIKFDPPV